MTYSCTATLELDLDVTADVHDGHAYLRTVVWQGVDILPGIARQPDVLRELEEEVWQRWHGDMA